MVAVGRVFRARAQSYCRPHRRAVGHSQSGPVWFLADTYGTKRTIRTCTVPRGKHLFFPLINYVVMLPASGRSVSGMAIMSSAAA